MPKRLASTLITISHMTNIGEWINTHQVRYSKYVQRSDKLTPDKTVHTDPEGQGGGGGEMWWLVEMTYDVTGVSDQTDQ